MKLTAEKLSTEQTDELITNRVNWILRYTKPQKIVLFGSAANDAMSTASDLDLIVIFQSRLELKQDMATLYKNYLCDGWPTDLLSYTSEEFETQQQKGGGVCWLAAREGRVLYDANKGETFVT
jgi:predicted nucleotidyltransferase